jgi:5-methylcytosine-specific restriction endonuclease McrA
MTDSKNGIQEKRKNYLEKLKDPRWQKLRLEVFERDKWTCQRCYDTESTLNVHHQYYKDNADPWDYPIEALVTLCENCHSEERVLDQAMNKVCFMPYVKSFSQRM